MSVHDGSCRLRTAPVSSSQHQNCMSSNIRITKICDHCGKEYEARTLHTRYCSHTCNRLHYKKVKREEKLRQFQEESEKATADHRSGKILEADNVSVTELQNKDYLSISETAIYLGVSKRTIERTIASGKLEFTRLNRRVLIPKANILKLLEI
jgi:excisionase family DNA binding protein